jgi:hypothetical protein
MSSMRLVGFGFVITMALLPAMLLSIARGHTEAADANIAAVASSTEDSKVRAWQGDAKPVNKIESAAEQAAAAAASSATVVELYLPDAEAAQVCASLSGDDEQRVVLSFGPSQSKAPAGSGVDPFMPTEAGKRRRDYGRVMGKGPEPVGPVVIASPAWVRVSDKPTAAWAREQAIAAAAIGASAELTVSVKSVAAKGDERKVAAEFSARVPKALGGMPEDAILNLFLTQPASVDTDAPMRVVLVRSFKLPKGGTGVVELPLPGGSKPTRLVAVLQHAKTMHILDTATAEMK